MTESLETTALLEKLSRDVVTMFWKVRMSRKQIVLHLVMNAEDYGIPASSDLIAPLVEAAIADENAAIDAHNRQVRREVNEIYAHLRATFAKPEYDWIHRMLPGCKIGR